MKDTAPFTVALLSQNNLLHEQLTIAVQRYFPAIAVAAAAPASLIIDVDQETKPQRLGAWLERIAAAQQPTSRPLIPCGPYQLAVADCLLYSETGDEIRLTEKERDILVRLQAASGEWVPRAVLLADLWGYGPGIETHTLETHIYRLRQKIEADPAAPRWLLNEETGYRLTVL